MSYIRPQTLVYQEKAELPASDVRELNAFLYGPNYALFRFAEAEEKNLIGLGSYDSENDASYDYPGKPSNSIPDASYAQLYLETAWLKYFTSDNPTVNPINVVSSGETNKIKAADRIMDSGQSFVNGISYDIGGYHYGAMASPEAYYFTPAATFGLGTAAGAFNWITTENYSGVMVIPADATVAGVETQGPNGLVFNFDNPGDVLAPRVYRFQSTLHGSYFDITTKAAELKNVIDSKFAAIDFHMDVANGTLAVAWDAPTGKLDITVADGATTLQELYDALVAANCPYLSVSEITGATADAVDLGELQDQDGNTVAGTGNIFVPDCSKVLVYDNSYIWKTENGYVRTPVLFKDVKIGDRVHWETVLSATGQTAEGYTQVAGFEPDYTLPKAEDAVADDNNDQPQSGDDLSAGIAVLSQGPDNQRTVDFDFAATKVYSNDADHRLDPDLVNNIITEAMIITVTTPGYVGDAAVSVVNASGTYMITNVPVQDRGVADPNYAGSVYLGKGMYVDFIADPAAIDTKKFLSGDQYMAVPIKADYHELMPPVVSGNYGGMDDTTYRLEVIRGGRFSNSVEVVDGVKVPANLALEADISGWHAGDVDDEYILKCVTAGSVNLAEWELTSQRGDNQTNIIFPGVGSSNALNVGASGLAVYLTGAPTDTADVGDTFIIKVYKAVPQVVVSDSRGIDQESTYTIAADVPFNVGLYGIRAMFPANANNGLARGQVFTIEAVASRAAAVHTIVLEDNLPAEVIAGLNDDGTANRVPDYISIELMLKENTLEVPKENKNPLSAPGTFNWNADAAGIQVFADMAATSSQWVDPSGDMPYLPVDTGQMYMQYRSLIMDYTDAIHGMTNITEVEALGVDHPDNPLGFAMNRALQNNGGVTVYFTAITSDDIAGDTEALQKASLTDIPYGIVPLTEDPERIDLAGSEVMNLSTPEKKLWRMMIFGRETQEGVLVVDRTQHPNGADYQATVTDDTRVPGTQITKVEFTEDAQLLSRVTVGDTVRLNFVTDPWGNAIHTERTVAEVASNTVLYLNSSLDAEILTPRKTEVWHDYTVQQQAEAEQTLSQSYGEERYVRVFPGRLGVNGVYGGSEFGAAAVAAAIGAVAPQQGLTYMEIKGFDDIPDVYNKFTNDQLDIIASGGTCILAQDTRGDQVYIRHELTTNYVEGDPDTSEIMGVKNLDAISYYLSGSLQGFIGKYNATDAVAVVIEANLNNGLNYLGSTAGSGLLGPQVILDEGNTKVVTVQVHPTLKDRILAIVSIQRPKTLNIIELHIVA